MTDPLRPRSAFVSRIPWHTFVAVGFVALALIVALAATKALAGVPDAPPRPVVVADGGASRQAAQGSYCWSGRESGICVDTIDPLEFAPTLRAQPGSTLTVRMGYPVERLSASTADDGKLELVSLDARGRKFELRLPEGEAGRSVDLYLFARYDRGSGFFALRVRSR